MTKFLIWVLDLGSVEHWFNLCTKIAGYESNMDSKLALKKLWERDS